MRKGTAFWPVFVVGIAMTSLTGAGVLIFFAHANGGVAVEPGYYEKAVDWDRSVHERAISERLRWTVTAESSPVMKPGEDVTLILTVRDAECAGLPGCAVAVEAFHYAESTRRVSPVARDLGGGRYLVSLERARPGRWAVRLSVARGDERFVTELDHRIESLREAVERAERAP